MSVATGGSGVAIVVDSPGDGAGKSVAPGTVAPGARLGAGEPDPVGDPTGAIVVHALRVAIRMPRTSIRNRGKLPLTSLAD